MKTLSKSAIDDSQVAVPQASETGPAQPATHDPYSDPGTGHIKRRQDEVAADNGTVHARSHGDAVSADRHPVQAPRSQDRDINANKGVTITTEAGVPVAHPGSTLR